MSILDGQMPLPYPPTHTCVACGLTYRVGDFHQCMSTGAGGTTGVILSQEWNPMTTQWNPMTTPPPMHPIKWRADNDKLAAENAALKAEVERLTATLKQNSAQFEHIADLRKADAAEVERLHGLWVEAGDARIQLEEDVRTLRADRDEVAAQFAGLRLDIQNLLNAQVLRRAVRGYANQTTSAIYEPPR